MTHFACADDAEDPMTLEQIRRFYACTEGISAERSLANSAGILQWPDSHADWVRPGLMLYGVSPLLGKTARSLDLKTGDGTSIGTFSCPALLSGGIGRLW